MGGGGGDSRGGRALEGAGRGDGACGDLWNGGGGGAAGAAAMMVEVAAGTSGSSSHATVAKLVVNRFGNWFELRFVLSSSYQQFRTSIASYFRTDWNCQYRSVQDKLVPDSSELRAVHELPVRTAAVRAVRSKACRPVPELRNAPVRASSVLQFVLFYRRNDTQSTRLTIEV